MIDWEMIRMTSGQRFKEATISFFGYAGAGIAYVIVASIILGLIATAFEFEGGLASIADLTNSIATLDPLGIAIGLIIFIVLGVLIWIFGIIGVMIRKAIGVKDNTKVSFDKRPAVLAFFMAGVVAVAIFAILQVMLVGLLADETFDATNIMSLLDAIVTVNPVSFLGALFGLAIIGFLVVKIASIEKGLGDKLPDPLKFGESG